MDSDIRKVKIAFQKAYRLLLIEINKKLLYLVDNPSLCSLPRTDPWLSVSASQQVWLFIIRQNIDYSITCKQKMSRSSLQTTILNYFIKLHRYDIMLIKNAERENWEFD